MRDVTAIPKVIHVVATLETDSVAARNENIISVDPA